MLAPLAEGSLILDEPRYAEAAAKAAGFLLDTMRTADGRLLHSYKDGQARSSTAYLDDYANLIDGLTRLFEATGEPRWIEAAVDLAGVMVEEFHDFENGGFYLRRREPRSPDRPPEGRLRQRHPVRQRHGRHGPRQARGPDGPRRFREARPVNLAGRPPDPGESPGRRGAEPDRPRRAARPVPGIRRDRRPRPRGVPRGAFGHLRAISAPQGRRPVARGQRRGGADRARRLARRSSPNGRGRSRRMFAKIPPARPRWSGSRISGRSSRRVDRDDGEIGVRPDLKRSGRTPANRRSWDV